MKKVFISQPMAGRTEQEIEKEREEVARSVKDMLGEDAEIIDSYIKEKTEGGDVPLKRLARSLEMLADADYICMADGWERARGCRIERTCAIEYGIAEMPKTPGCEGGSCRIDFTSGVSVKGG